MNETRCKTGQRQWTNAGARGISSYLVQVLMAKDCVGILQGPPGSHTAFPCCCSRINMSHMFIRLHAGLLLWVLLKPIPDLFALKIRNQFIPSLNVSMASLQLHSFWLGAFARFSHVFSPSTCLSVAIISPSAPVLVV